MQACLCPETAGSCDAANAPSLTRVICGPLEPLHIQKYTAHKLGLSKTKIKLWSSQYIFIIFKHQTNTFLPSTCVKICAALKTNKCARNAAEYSVCPMGAKQRFVKPSDANMVNDKFRTC